MVVSTFRVVFTVLCLNPLITYIYSIQKKRRKKEAVLLFVSEK